MKASWPHVCKANAYQGRLVTESPWWQWQQLPHRMCTDHTSKFFFCSTQPQEIFSKSFSKKLQLLYLQKHTVNHCFLKTNYQYCFFYHQYYVKLELKNKNKHVNCNKLWKNKAKTEKTNLKIFWSWELLLIVQIITSVTKNSTFICKSRKRSLGKGTR